MTPDYDAIKARAEAATEGPWDHFRSAYLGNLVHRIGSASDVDDVAFVPCSWGHEADAEFISNARQDIPDLLTEVERLLAVIDRVREVHAEGEFGCPYPSHGCNDFYYRGNYCPDAGTSCEACGEKYPCPTIRALGGAL